MSRPTKSLRQPPQRPHQKRSRSRKPRRQGGLTAPMLLGLLMSAIVFTVSLPYTSPLATKLLQKWTITATNRNHLAPDNLRSDTDLASPQVIEILKRTAIATRPSVWPAIHGAARLAKVPVIMYHDILPDKEVFFDVTPEELAADFEFIKAQGATPISLDWLIAHLRTGMPLPEKPVLLTFDDGYGGHYEYVYQLLKAYNYPAVFSIYTKKMELVSGRSSITWEQLQEMAADPLVTITSHSVNHPDDLRELADEELEFEIVESKRILEERLGIPIRYFTYPVGRSDKRVRHWVKAAGYEAALAMDDNNEHFAGDSPDVLTIGRFGQSQLESVLPEADGGVPLPNEKGFNYEMPIRREKLQAQGTRVTLISGGKPATIHADSRYQVPEIIEGTGAVAAVDGSFFSMQYLDSNAIIGPVYSQNTNEFIPGNLSENQLLRGRPLVLISPTEVKYIPFDPDRHSSLVGIQAEIDDVTDAFVAAAWLVRDNQPQPSEAFGDLFDFDAVRFRAFWGINQTGAPVVGVSTTRVGSVRLGQVLHELGLRDAVMLDSGGSTSLAYEGTSQVGYTPRPVPHVVALFPSDDDAAVAEAETALSSAEVRESGDAVAPSETAEVIAATKEAHPVDPSAPYREKIPLHLTVAHEIFRRPCQVTRFEVNGCEQ